MINVIRSRLYLADHSGDIQTITAGLHMSTVNVQNKMWTEERENGWLTTMPTKHKNLNFHTFNIVPYSYTVHR